MYAKLIKPVIDFVVSFTVLIVISPLFLLIVIFLKCFQKGGVFFKQVRPGRNGKLFQLIKFKTMSDARDLEGNLLPDEARLTWIGKFIRKTSLDELPQLVNVIKGEMSLVGPRPLLEEYLKLYSEDQLRRHDVKPGITGWAQVNGRNTISWAEKFDYDIYYVQNQSFLLDMKIIVLTILKVFKAEGINAEGMATVDKFKGNK